MRNFLLTTCFVQCLALPAPVLAQTQNGEGASDQKENSEISDIDARQEADNLFADDAIVVTGRAQKLYRVQETFTGKLPTEPLTSSQTITTITEQLIEDQGARDAQDLYRNISGVTTFSYAGVTARGFRQEENFYDGLRGDPYAGFSVPQLFNVERVEFLKGPAGMLYGPSAPGGLFNYITKKPSQDFEAEISAVAGTENRFGGSAEINAPIGQDVAVRGAVFYEDQDLFRSNAASRNLILDFGFLYNAGPVQITLQATRYDQELDANRLRGVPVDDEGNFLTSPNWNHNEPTDYLNLKSDVLQARVDAQPTDNLSLNATIRYNDGFEEQQYHEPRGLFDSDGDGIVDSSIREFRDQMRFTESLSLGANAIWSAKISENVSNRVLAGFDFYDEDFVGSFRPSLRGTTTVVAGLPNPLSLFDPQYGQSDSRSYNLQPFVQSSSKAQRQGVYLLNETTIGRFILTGGLRFDKFDDDNGSEIFSDDKITYRIGGVYRVRDNVSLYGQYATSFEPQSIGSQDSRAGGPFAPTSGDIIEGGIKTAILDGAIQSTLAVYEIRRTNILQSDPRGDVAGDGVDDLIPLGEITSTGVEFDIAADLTPDWVLTLAYGYNDTRITGDNGGGGFSFNIGDRFPNAPKHQLGAWTRYQIPEIGLAFALGADYVSERLSMSGQRVKPYAVFDASIIFERGPFRAMVRIDNLFDKTYAESGFLDRTGHFPGEPRSAFLEIKYGF